MNVIWLLLRSSWVSVAIAIVTGLISGGCSAQLIALINRAIAGEASSTLIWYFVGLAVVALIASAVCQFLLVDLAQGAVFNLRLRLSEGILSAPLRHLEELGANRLMATLTEDVMAISNSVFVIPFLCVDIAVILGCLVYLASLSGIVFAVVVVMLVVAIATVQLLLNRLRYHLTLAREEDDRLFKHFRGITEGIKELKLHTLRRQQFLTDELQVSAAASRDHRSNGLKVGAIAIGWGQLLFFINIGFLLFGLPRLVNVTQPVLAAYVLTITYLLVPFQNVLERLPNLFTAGIAVKKVERMGLELEQKAELHPVTQQAIATDWPTLELNQVRHSYPGEKEDSQFILGPVNLTFRAGELVFIVGGNGSGKSTLAKILTGLYVPESGEIRLGGRAIAEQNREWYRQHFSTIFADFYLFERLLGIEHPDLDAQAHEYLREFHLDQKVRVVDGILSTTSLSTGQRKRLALLTAYLEDRPIYLFDEWASDQDPFFREIFYKQLLPDLKQRGKTIFVISHDDRYFSLGDRVIKLDYGQVESDQQQ